MYLEDHYLWRDLTSLGFVSLALVGKTYTMALYTNERPIVVIGAKDPLEGAQHILELFYRRQNG